MWDSSQWARLALTASLGSCLWTASALADTTSPSPFNVEIQLKDGHDLVSTNSEMELDHPQGFAEHAKSAIVMDYATGKVLFDKDADKHLPLASVTKVMTMLLIMEAIDSGKIKMDDQVKTSEYAASMGGSQIFLEPGESMTVKDMLRGIAVASANDACVAMAEHLYGSEAAFVQKMNRKAKDLGLKDTHFVNCNGLPAPHHYSSAHDIAVMSRELLKHKDITKFTSVYSDYLRQGTDHPLWLVNTNKLVRFYEGVDGLKTGFTREAMYCLSATAKRGEFRVIAVVLGEPKSTVRNAEVSQLLNWSFSQFESKVIYQAGQKVSELPVRHGVKKTVDVVAGDTVGAIVQKGTRKALQTQVDVGTLKAPIEEGDKVGTIRVLDGKRVVSEAALLAAQDVDKANFFQTIGQTIRSIVTFGRS